MSNIDKYDKVFMKSFKIKKDKLNNLKYNSIAQWDSVGHMSMIGSLEEDIIDFSSYKFGKKILKKYKIKI